jgi:hypothetical protein
VRVCGDGHAALFNWDYEKYWAGEFEVPMTEILAASTLEYERWMDAADRDDASAALRQGLAP